MADGGDNVHQITNSKRGPFIIINNETFTNKKSREGTEHDVKKLKATFGGTFGFEVVVHNNQTAEEIRGIIQKLGGGDYSACDCIGIAILTHGKEGSDHIVYGRDGGVGKDEVDLDTVFRPLENCQSLAGKPKLILVQAGTLHVDGPPIYMNESSESDMVDEVYEANIVPVASAFSYYFALDVPAGRNERKLKEKGSIFIQTFCNILLENSNGELDVEKLKIRANYEISKICGETPVSQSTLLGNFFLKAVVRSAQELDEDDH